MTSAGAVSLDKLGMRDRGYRRAAFIMAIAWRIALAIVKPLYRAEIDAAGGRARA